MKVDETTLLTSQANTTEATLSKTTPQDLDESIHSPTKSSWIEEVDTMHIDKTSLSSNKTNSSQILKEKITVAIHLRDDNVPNTNQTASSSVNKENSPEEETFIKVLKVTFFCNTQ